MIAYTLLPFVPVIRLHAKPDSLRLLKQRIGPHVAVSVGGDWGGPFALNYSCHALPSIAANCTTALLERIFGEQLLDCLDLTQHAAGLPAKGNSESAANYCREVGLTIPSKSGCTMSCVPRERTQMPVHGSVNRKNALPVPIGIDI
jgi:hypothetical protein